MRKKVVNAKRLKKEKIKLFKYKILLFVLSSSLIMGYAGKKGYDKYEKNRVKHENSIGYYDVNPYDYFKVKEDNFVLLNVGDYNTPGSILLEQKVNKCISDNISVGIVVNGNVDNEEAIYNDVELAKGVLARYSIDFPVFLNIDYIMENESLNVDTKTKLIKDFLDKCQSNSMYVSVYGKDDNLCKMKEYCKILDYDALVVGDKDCISYDGKYTMVKDNNGKIYSKENLSNTIKKNSLNNSSNFLSDGSYKVGKDETIMDISFKFGMSVKDLLNFNDLKKEDINEGVILRIPSSINTNTYIEKSNPISLDEPKLGVDISVHQGNNIDFETLKNNVDFAILRVSHGLNEDALFESNVVNCNKYNIPMGVYCYHEIKRDECDDITFSDNVKKEAKLVCEKLKNKKVDYPVFLDLEVNESKEGAFRENYSLKDIKIILDAWNEVVSEYGYIPGVYCNRDVYRYISSTINDVNEDLCLWIAGGEEYNNVATPENLTSYNNDYNADILQISQYGHNFGAKNIDVDLSYIDFSNKDKEYSDDVNFDIKQFDQYETIKKIGIISASGLVIGTGALLLGKRKRVKK